MCTMGADLGSCQVDTLLLERAIMNVGSNAIDYSPYKEPFTLKQKI